MRHIPGIPSNKLKIIYHLINYFLNNFACFDMSVTRSTFNWRVRFAAFYASWRSKIMSYKIQFEIKSRMEEDKTPPSYSQVNQRDEKSHFEFSRQMYLMMSKGRAKEIYMFSIDEHNKELKEFINDAAPASILDDLTQYQDKIASQFSNYGQSIKKKEEEN